MQTLPPLSLNICSCSSLNKYIYMGLFADSLGDIIKVLDSNFTFSKVSYLKMDASLRRIVNTESEEYPLFKYNYISYIDNKRVSSSVILIVNKIKSKTLFTLIDKIEYILAIESSELNSDIKGIFSDANISLRTLFIAKTEENVKENLKNTSFFCKKIVCLSKLFG